MLSNNPFFLRLKQHKAANILLVFVVVQALCICASLLFPEQFRYLAGGNLETLLKTVPVLAILSIGVGILMIAGEFDLSVGSTFAFTSFAMAWMFNHQFLPASLAALLAILMGGLMGLLNGLITVKARIPSFIATLGTMMFWRGIILVCSQGVTQPFRPEAGFESVFAGSFGGLQIQFFWLIAIAIGGYLLLERHKFGNHVFAVGGNAASAVAIGVNPKQVKVLCFTLVGMLSALAGVLSTVRVHSVSPVQGRGMELQAIAACVIGGLSLSGGRGTILGILLGAALLHTIDNVLILLRAPGDSLELFIGLLIVAAAILNNLSNREQSGS